MPLPSRARCLDVMEELAVPDNIRRHSLLVADVAVALARELRARGEPLDLDLVEAAALLHDVGKARSLETGEDHGVLGADMVSEIGYPALAPIIREHTLLSARRLGGRVDESLLVNYCDKRVRHDEVVSLERRLEDLADRYCRTPEQRRVLDVLMDLYTRLERQIFAGLGFGPDDVAGLVGTR
jgi:putative nucleotidyltransferase with HDIG domain